MTEFERRRAEIEDLMADYAQAITAAAAWWRDYRKRNSGFRCTRSAPELRRLESDRVVQQTQGGFRCKG